MNQLSTNSSATTKLTELQLTKDTIDLIEDLRRANDLLKNQKAVIMTANKMFSAENNRLKIENERLFDEVQNLKTKLARITFR